jgi:predicted signal transduction protein with EAL and GGDEF domain
MIGWHRPPKPANSATVLAGRIIEQLTTPFEVEGHRILVGTSVGIAVAPNDGSVAGTLLNNADLALYQVKGRGRGSYQFFEPGMDALMHAGRRLESDLREAVAASSFELHFQPILNLDHERVTEFEALVRWRHPEQGIVSPAEFIPLAEEIGLIRTSRGHQRGAGIFDRQAATRRRSEQDDHRGPPT